MTFDKKLIEAQEERRARAIKSAIVVTILTVIAVTAVIFLSDYQNNQEIKPTATTENSAPSADITETFNEAAPANLSSVPDEQLRQAYINAVNDYQNKLQPQLDNIDLLTWDKDRSDRLVTLQDTALSKFSTADYAGALQDIEQAKRLAETLLNESQQQFEQFFTKAQTAYDADRYDDAKFEINQALMLNKSSTEALNLAQKIETLPEIVSLLEKINTAKVENKYEQELKLLKDLIHLAPHRQSAIDRKQTLVSLINNKNFKSAINQAHKAIQQGDADLAKQKVVAARKIFPERPEIAETISAIKELEKQQRLVAYRQDAQNAMANDNWSAAKIAIELALKENNDDQKLQQLLLKTTSIISLQNELEQHLNNPYRLANQQLQSKVKNQLEKAAAFSTDSPSLNKTSAEVAQLITLMNNKVSVEISSDKLTHILVRGVGVVGLTELKTIQLPPGHYKFEGKRKGYKSKLIDVLIPYDQSHYQLNIQCDEPI